MKIVKLTTPWDHNFYAQTPGNKGIIGEFKFEIDNDCDEADFWIVWGGLKKTERVRCNKDCIVYLTDESHSERIFNQVFLNQFSKIIACRTDLSHPFIIPSHDLGIWHFKKSYDEVLAIKDVEKTKVISVVSSDLTYLEGHKKRFAFVNKMIGHFKDKLDVFGRGFNYIEDKYDGIASYKYSIAIENSLIAGYFTEKLFECFLTYTLPIYYGCQNVDQYFDQRSLLLIDIDDYKSAILKIEEAMESDLYSISKPFIQDSRRKFLKDYHVFPVLTRILSSSIYFPASSSEKKVENTLLPEKVIISGADQFTNHTTSSFLYRVARRLGKNIR